MIGEFRSNTGAIGESSSNNSVMSDIKGLEHMKTGIEVVGVTVDT